MCVSPLFSYPLGTGLRTESYLSEDVQWDDFVKVCYENMQLREGCEPQLTWKFSDGRGSKDWITLQDEGAYKCMMKTAAERVRSRVKKEPNITDPDLRFGWRVDIQPATSVQRVEEAEDMVASFGEREREDERAKKQKKASKAKVPAKRKHSRQKKVSFLCQP